MKLDSAIFAFSLASPLLAARLVGETERMMKENVYQGVWLEKHHDEALKVAFSTNGWMIVDYRGCPQLFKWKSNGKGLIELAPGEMPEKTVMKFKYLPKEDIMDCGFEGKKTQLDFTGRLAFKSTGLSAEHAEALREATVQHERYREERFERLKKSGDPRLKRVENLKDVLDPNWLARNRVWVETVDLEYPQIISCKGITDQFSFINVFYGARGFNKVRKHEFYEPLNQQYKLPQKEIDVGFSREIAEKAKTELEETGSDPDWFYCEYGEGNKRWQEEGLCVYFGKSNRDKVGEILARYFSADRPRYVLINKLVLFEESGVVTENFVEEDGKKRESE